MLTVLCGIPGSGKTTWRDRCRQGDVIVCLDEIRRELTGDPSCQAMNDDVYRLARRRVRQALGEGRDVTVDATNTTRTERGNWVELAEEAGVEARCVWLQASVDQAMAANDGRDRNVPREVIERMARRLQPPRRSEGFTEVLVVPRLVGGPEA
ncbi:MAG: AAA family ATPase [Armatimonadia bacterium]|nr:AAA family ATPase [Armatimonadia bacterium]